MSEIIERVARAAYFAGEGIFGEDAFNPINDAHWAHWWSEDRAEHEAIARAVIGAMRDPTPGMLRATGNCRGCEPINWQSMIDAALEAPAPIPHDGPTTPTVKDSLIVADTTQEKT